MFPKLQGISLALTLLPTRFSVTMKETPSNPLAYGSASAISPVKNLCERNWEATIQRYKSPENSFANTSISQRAKPDEHCASIHLLEWLRKGNGRKHLLKR